MGKTTLINSIVGVTRTERRHSPSTAAISPNCPERRARAGVAGAAGAQHFPLR